jgi:hypothetical protein
MFDESLANDSSLIEELYQRFHSASEEIFARRIMNLRIDDLPFRNADGNPFGKVMHLVRGEDKSRASFDIYRLGWFGGRVWELVIIDGAYLPHAHQKIDSEFVIFKGSGHLSHDDEWSFYQEKTRTPVGRRVGHGFITDPEFGPTVFLSIQSDPIRKIWTNPDTQAQMSEDDFVYVDDKFPLHPGLLAQRNEKLQTLSQT